MRTRHPHFSLLEPAIAKRVQAWLDGPYSTQTKRAIAGIKDPVALRDAFYTDLTFGTGGLRALMGIGTNRMNQYTVRMATQGLANYILKQKFQGAAPSVFIGFDSRHNSELFAKESAQILAAMGINVYLLTEMRPTPFISFATRTLKCTAGIMITASHNPKEYNGYKVYWSDGGQVVQPHDAAITEEVHAIKKIDDILLAPLNDSHIELIGNTLDAAYLAAIRPLQHFPDNNKLFGATLNIIYTSLHGTGITLAPLALKDWGFTSLHYVEEQILPNGDFPTVQVPNPECSESLTLGIHKLMQTQSDILIATDPDADRVGIAVRHRDQPVILSGNAIASLCADFLCTNHAPGAFVTTIATTELVKTIAAAHNKPCVEVLTGFKYIGEKIHEWETHPGEPGNHQFLFGAEESCGYLLGTHARDKDAQVTSCLLAEMALQAKMQGKTLVDVLHAIYCKYGIFREKQLSVHFASGELGMQQITSLMEQLRGNPFKGLNGKPVVIIEDYATGVRTHYPSAQKELLTLPKSNAMLFRLNGGDKFIIRASGTEPKVKVYASVFTKDFSSVDEGIQISDNYLDQMLLSIEAGLKHEAGTGTHLICER